MHLAARLKPLCSMTLKGSAHKQSIHCKTKSEWCLKLEVDRQLILPIPLARFIHVHRSNFKMYQYEYIGADLSAKPRIGRPIFEAIKCLMQGGGGEKDIGYSRLRAHLLAISSDLARVNQCQTSDQVKYKLKPLTYSLLH